MVNKKYDFPDSISVLLSSIGVAKKELRRMKNEELKKISQREKDEIRLARARAKNQRKKILERYEKRKQSIGKSLLKEKNLTLGKHLSRERDSLRKTDRGLRKVRESLRKTQIR